MSETNPTGFVAIELPKALEAKQKAKENFKGHAIRAIVRMIDEGTSQIEFGVSAVLSEAVDELTSELREAGYVVTVERISKSGMQSQKVMRVEIA